MKIYYCPVCGTIAPCYRTHCHDCHTDVTTGESKYHDWYYADESIRLYGDKRMRLQILIEREVRTNPKYDPAAHKRARREFDEKCRQTREAYTAPPLPVLNLVPSCPDCGSSNTKKLSFLNRYLHYRAIGFLSETARSTYVCNNCGRKW